MSSMWIYVIRSCLSDRPVFWRGKNFDVGHYTQTFKYFFYTCHAYRHHLLLTFYTTFTDLDLGCGVTRSVQSKTSWIHFLALFSVDLNEI